MDQVRDIPGAAPSNSIQARQLDCSGLITGEAITAIYSQLPPNTALAFMAGTVAGVGTGYLTQGFCHGTHAGEETAEERCTGWGSGVGGLVFLVVGGAILWANSRTGTVVQDLSGATELPVRDEGFTRAMRDALHQGGLEFEEVITAPLQTRDSAEGRTVEIMGLRDPETGIASDHVHHIREDGRSWARMTPSIDSSMGSTAKRHLGPGIKISYEFTNFNEQSTMKIEEADLQGIGQTFGADWENRVNANENFSRYFGQAKIGDDYTVRFEIIPEEDQFNDDCEKVNQCGIWD